MLRAACLPIHQGLEALEPPRVRFLGRPRWKGPEGLLVVVETGSIRQGSQTSRLNVGGAPRSVHVGLVVVSHFAAGDEGSRVPGHAVEGC